MWLNRQPKVKMDGANKQHHPNNVSPKLARSFFLLHVVYTEGKVKGHTCVVDIEKFRPPPLQDSVNPFRHHHRGPHPGPNRGMIGLRPVNSRRGTNG